MTIAATVSSTSDFLLPQVYQPPIAAHNARRIVVKPNLGYPKAHPVTVSPPVLGAVLRELRRVAPHAEIFVVEGVCSAVAWSEIMAQHAIAAWLDEGMQLLDADELPTIAYPNQAKHPQRFSALFAPELLQTVDCCLSIGTFKRTLLKQDPLISAALKNLYGLLPRAKYRARSPHSRGQLHRPSVAAVLQDVYGCIGHLFQGAIVDVTLRLVSPDWRPDRGQTIDCQQIIWGDSLLQVDQLACQVCNEPLPDYLQALLRLE